MIDKIILSEKTGYQLSILKGRTGFNVGPLCRLALCVSLKDSSLPKFEHYNKKGREIERTEFFQVYEKILVAFVKQRCYEDNFDVSKDFEKYFLGHLNRGIEILSNRVKKIEDVVYIFE